MVPLSKAEIKKRRRHFLTKASRVTNIKKGDKRVSSSTRLCAICGNQLSLMTPSTGQIMAKENHYSCYMNELAQVNICENIKSCYSRHNTEE